MNPQILLALATLAVALPAILDEIIKAKVVNPLTVGLLTQLVGVVFGALGGLATQLAHGSTVSDALTVFAAGAISGFAAAIVNYAAALNKARTVAALAAPVKLSALCMLVLAGMLALSLSGCKSFLASPLLPDLQADEQCVVTEIENGDLTVAGVAHACFANVEKTAVDAFIWLLDSQKFVQAHPAAIAPMRSNMMTWRAGHPTAVLTPWRSRAFASGPARPAFSGAF